MTSRSQSEPVSVHFRGGKDHSQAEHLIQRYAIGLGLTALAGWIDAAGFIRLGKFYTSFMSGNTTQLAIDFAGLSWQAMVLPGLLIGLFTFGVFVGSVIDRLVRRHGITLGMLLETALLAGAAYLTLEQSQVIFALAPLPAAMGIQNAIVRRLDTGGAGQTFITSALVSTGEAVAEAVLRGRWAALSAAMTWIAMAAGAATAAVVDHRSTFWVLVIPAFALVCSIPFVLRCPRHTSEDHA